MGNQAFYWPTGDKLAFAFAGGAAAAGDDEDENSDEQTRLEASNMPAASKGFSSGERQLKSLQEIAHRTQAVVYLLDEWDANLDTQNRASAEAIVASLATRAVVVEISHRDRL
ncbi:MAG: hypothetical protein H7Z77_01320 [Chitinophagaceae bacterium]|nr:hypothetical protein [Polaromonas sp.]